MISHTGDVLLRIVAWTFVPDFVTRGIIRYLFPSQTSNPTFYRRTFATVIAGYLLYNIYIASTTTPPNFYQILKVPVDADENTLKMAFRVFARKNHPDRAGPKAEHLFIQVRDAYDGLRHPIKRFAYDRFGPDIFGWESCGTPRECVNSGLLGSIGFYIASTFFMGVTWLFGARDSGSFWRYVLFFGLFVTELSFVLAPSPHSLLAGLFPQRVPFQHVQYIHQLFLSVSIAIQRIYPALLPDLVDAQELSREVDPEVLAAATGQIAMLARNVETETRRMVVSDLRTLHVAAGVHDPKTEFVPSALSSSILDTLRTRAVAQSAKQRAARVSAHAGGPHAEEEKRQRHGV
ncbi:chaperone J-domain-containing protein [Exidia glandulosa HHB12029]|uniref:Chaperone J-domain-containing protein n=1 Tax=Exidia glandulosa HHB12029 TaxID=1314781 RepID=A0A165G6T3_EXIGL|nr:chaperone J-domain-containing protein [Exidia glandulosa HHB12029]